MCTLIACLNEFLFYLRKFTLKDADYSLGNSLFGKCLYLTKCDKKENIPLKLAYLKK